jgi:Leu/Phe-tRNA-protein transferase
MHAEGLLHAVKPLIQSSHALEGRKGMLALSALVRGYAPGMVQLFKDPDMLAWILSQVRTSMRATCGSYCTISS